MTKIYSQEELNSFCRETLVAVILSLPLWESSNVAQLLVLTSPQFNMQDLDEKMRKSMWKTFF